MFEKYMERSERVQLSCNSKKPNISTKYQNILFLKLYNGNFKHTSILEKL